MTVRSGSDSSYLGQAIELFNECARHMTETQGNPSHQFMDSFGLPEGALQSVMTPVREIFPETWFANYIPVNPLRAPGSDKLTYPRITQYGSGRFRSIGSNVRNKIDIGLSNIEFLNRRDAVYFDMDRYESDRLTFAMQNRNYLGAVNLLAEKQRAVENDAARKRDLILAKGSAYLGLLGFLNNPDVLRLVLSESFPSATPANNTKLLSQALEMIAVESGGTFSPTTLVLPPKDHTTLNNQERSTSASDKTTLQFFAQNQGNAFFDDGSRPFEIDKSAQLENGISNGVHAAIFLCRRMECVEQVIPLPVTFYPPVATLEGYQVPADAEYSSLLLKHPYSAVVVEYSRP